MCEINSLRQCQYYHHQLAEKLELSANPDYKQAAVNVSCKHAADMWISETLYLGRIFQHHGQRLILLTETEIQPPVLEGRLE